jgi:hypothetical protein
MVIKTFGESSYHGRTIGVCNVSSIAGGKFKVLVQTSLLLEVLNEQQIQ